MVGDQARQHVGQHRAYLPVGAHDDRGVAGVHTLAGGCAQQGLRRERAEHSRAQGTVQRAGRHRCRHEVERVLGLRGELGVGLGRPGDEEVGERPRRDVASSGVERERGDQQRGQVEGLVGRGRRVHRRRHRLPRHRTGPGQRPPRPVPLLDGAVEQQLRVEGTRAAYDVPPGRVRHHPCRPVGHDLDLGQVRQREQQGVIDLREQPSRERGSIGVAQGQRDGRGEARLRELVARQGQPQDRQLAPSSGQLLGQRRNGEDGVSGSGRRPPQGPGVGSQPGLIGHGQDGRETDTEASRGCPVTDGAVSLGRGPQGRERLGAGRVERRTGVGRNQLALGQP